LTVSRLREQRTQEPVEERSSIGGAYSNGFAYTDFSAVPPPGLGELQRAGVVITADSLLQLDVVFTSLRLITTAILRTGNLRAYEEKLSTENIPFRRYLKKQPSLLTETFLGANGKVYQYDGRRKTLMSMALFGEAFWYILTRSKPAAYATAVEVLHPAFMEVKIANQQDVAAKRASNIGESMYIYGAANDKKLLDPGDVVHIPFMSMPQSRRALSSVRYAGISGALALAAYEFGSTWFSQGAAPSWLLTTDQKLGTAEVERIADKFLVNNSGLGNAHHPLVLDSGIKPEKALASPDEAQYLNTLSYARSVVASWFGTDELIPDALLRQTPAPAHTAQEKMQRFVTLTLSGYTTPLEEIHADLLPGEQKAGFEEHKLLTPDPQFLAQEIETLRNGQIGTINNIRVRKLGWEPLDDPAADEAIAPLASNTAPSQTGGGKKGEPDEKGKASEPDEDDDGDEPPEKGDSLGKGKS
jgi:HK97 family phage portal protein